MRCVGNFAALRPQRARAAQLRRNHKVSWRVALTRRAGRAGRRKDRQQRCATRSETLVTRAARAERRHSPALYNSTKTGLRRWRRRPGRQNTKKHEWRKSDRGSGPRSAGGRCAGVTPCCTRRMDSTTKMRYTTLSHRRPARQPRSRGCWCPPPSSSNKSPPMRVPQPKCTALR